MLRKSIIRAALALGLALPSAAFAATERWNFTPSDGTTHLVSGYIDIDRTGQTVTAGGGTLTITTASETYTYQGEVFNNSLILENDSPVTVGQGLFVVRLANMATATIGPVDLPGFLATCAAVDGGRCVEAEEVSNNQYVTATLYTAPTAVPTLTQWAMILMGTALAGGAVLTLQARRRRA